MGKHHPELEKRMQQLLNWAYDCACKGIGTFQSATQLANKYRATETQLDQIIAIEQLFANQLKEATTIGFVSGVGGIVTAPITLPANIFVITFLQVRLSATVAVLKGYDLTNESTKILVLLALAGNNVEAVAHDTGVKIGVKLGEQVVEVASEEVVAKIVEKIGVRFAAFLGEVGLMSIETLLPLAGGVIDATIDRVIFKETQCAVWQLFLKEDEQGNMM
ncbi:MAG: hypothetical protein ACRDAO_00490 [Culicoidibacterales bacterium]